MSTESITDLQFQETSAKSYKSQAVALSCNIPIIIAKIVKQAHIPHAIIADTTAYTACNIPHIATIVSIESKTRTIMSLKSHTVALL